MIDEQKRGFMQFQDIRAFLDSILDEENKFQSLFADGACRPVLSGMLL